MARLADPAAPMNSEASPPPDPGLARYLAAEGEEARERLGELLGEVASPLVWKVIRRQLGGRSSGFAEEDLEDLHAAALMRLQLQLEAVRSGEREAMASLRDYVAVVGFNAVSSFLMAREPERTRLRQRARYVLRKGGELAVWVLSGQETACGLAAWRGRPAAPAAGRLGEVAAEAVARIGREPAGFGSLLAAVLAGFGAPCRFEDLVDALALALDVRDDAPIDLAASSAGDGEEERAVREPVDTTPAADAALAARQLLARLWDEILELPANQRAALLLNLRDEGGGDMLSALLESGVVDPPGLAVALGLTAGEVAELLPGLPLEDLRVAERLGLTRQQVINLRKSARLRLGRRMRGFLPGMGV